MAAGTMARHDSVEDTAFVLADDKVAMRKLKLGRTLGDDREVLDGLADGELVVLEPKEDLVDGAQVKRITENKSDK